MSLNLTFTSFPKIAQHFIPKIGSRQCLILTLLTEFLKIEERANDEQGLNLQREEEKEV